MRGRCLARNADLPGKAGISLYRNQIAAKQQPKSAGEGENPAAPDYRCRQGAEHAARTAVRSGARCRARRGARRTWRVARPAAARASSGSTRRAPPRSGCREHRGDPLEAVLINTAGGLTGGDRLDWSIAVGDGASATVTTQTCEKVYRASSGIAEVGCRLSVGGGRAARLAAARDDRVRQFGVPQDDRDRPCRRGGGADRRGDACSAAAPWARASDGRFRRPLACQATRPAGPCRGFRRRSASRRAACRAAGARRRDLCCNDRLLLTAMPSSGSTRCAPIIGDAGGASAWTVGGIWQASCEACRRRRLRAAQAADPAHRTAQRAGRPAQSLDTLGTHA